jgi:hypothetical protein
MTFPGRLPIHIISILYSYSDACALLIEVTNWSVQPATLRIQYILLLRDSWRRSRNVVQSDKIASRGLCSTPTHRPSITRDQLHSGKMFTVWVSPEHLPKIRPLRVDLPRCRSPSDRRPQPPLGVGRGLSCVQMKATHINSSP